MLNFFKKYACLVFITVLTYSLSYGINNENYFNKGDKSLSKYFIGTVLSSSGDCANAIPYFEEALEQHKDPAIYLELAQCYVYSNALEKAIELLEESIKEFPNYRESYELAGNIYYQMYLSGIAPNDIQKKAVKYLEIACDNGKYPSLCMKAVDVSVSLKNLGTAADIFEEMNLNEIRDARFLAFAISIYQSTNNLNMVKRIIKAISRLNVEDTKLLDLLVNTAINTSMFNEAKIFMDKVIEIQGDNFKAWDKYMFVLLETDEFHKIKSIYKSKYSKKPTILALYTLANCYSKEHNYIESIDYYKQVFKVDKGNWDRNIIRDIYSDYLKILLITGKYKQALKEVEKYKRENPDDKSLLIDYFNVYAFNGKKKFALETLNQLRDLLKNKEVADNLKEIYLNSPSFFKARYLGNVYYSLKDYKKARKYLERAFKKNKGAKEVGVPLASLYETLNLPDKVLEVYKTLLKHNKDSADILNNYSYSLLMYKKNLEFALQMAIKSNELAPNNPIYKDTLGYAYLLTGDLKNAEKNLLFSYSKIADNSEVCDHLGDLYFLKKDYKSAIKYWQEAILNGIKSKQEVLEKIEQAKELL